MAKAKQGFKEIQSADFRDNPDTFKTVSAIYETLLSITEGLSYVDCQEDDEEIIQSLQIDTFTLKREIFQLLVLTGIKETCTCNHSD